LGIGEVTRDRKRRHLKGDKKGPWRFVKDNEVKIKKGQAKHPPNSKLMGGF